MQLHTLVDITNIYQTQKFQGHILKNKVTTEGSNNLRNGR